MSLADLSLAYLSALVSRPDIGTYPRSLICRLIRLHPTNILAPSITPSSKYFPSPFETLARTASNPEKDERRVRRKLRDGEGLQRVSK